MRVEGEHTRWCLKSLTSVTNNRRRRRQLIRPQFNTPLGDVEMSNSPVTTLISAAFRSDMNIAVDGV